MSKSDVLTINIDGAARGNPGPAAYAYVIAKDGQLLSEEARRMGTATNNVAEYSALVRALERAAELGGKPLLIKSDSELLVKQMNGVYRVKDPRLKILHEQASRLREQFPSVSIVHVPRAENSHADRLCNEALDGLRDAARSTVSSDTKSADRKMWHANGLLLAYARPPMLGGTAIRLPQRRSRFGRTFARSSKRSYREEPRLR